MSHKEFAAPADISADVVNRYAGKLRDRGQAARTIQAHLTAIKAFTKWIAEHHKLPRNPLESIRIPNPKADRRRERRMLLPDEWKRIEVATLNGPVRDGMSGEERALLYAPAIQTGLRSSELRSLTRGRLFLDSEPPYITCMAGTTKSRKQARQYIQQELAARLVSLIARKSPKAPVFGLPDRTVVAGMMRADVAEAHKAWLRESRPDPDLRLS